MLYCLFLTFAHAQDVITKDSSMYNLQKLVRATPFPKEDYTQQAFTERFTKYYTSFKNKNFQSLNKIFSNPISINEAVLNYSGISDSSYIRNNKQYYLGQFDLNIQADVIGIPVVINYKDQQWSDINVKNDFIGSLNFNKEAYLNALKKGLGNKLNFNQYEDALADPLAFIKQRAEMMLRAELNKINQKYGNVLTAQIKEFGTFNELIKKDITLIRQKLLNKEFLIALANEEQLLTELQQKINLGEAIDTALFKKVSKNVLEANGVKELITKLEEHKGKWESSGLITKIKEWDVKKRQKLLSFLNEPETIRSLARKHLSLNNLQKLFLKINQLSIGQNTISHTPLSISHFFYNGFLSEFAGKSKAVMFFSGKQPAISSINDLSFSNTGLNIKSVKALRFSIKSAGAAQSQISIMSFDQGLSEIAGNSGFNAYSRAIVTTLNREFVIGKKGNLSTEISKSITNYNLKTNNATDSGRQDMEGLLFPNHILENAAFRVRYEDEYPHINLAYTVHFQKTANGYNNPGNSFLNQGSKEGGISVRKGFLKKKLQISLRTDVREYQYSDKINTKWRSTYKVIDARWRMNRGQSLGLRYLPNQMVKIEGQNKTVVSTFNRLSVDASLARKINQFIYYNNYSSLSYQKNNYYQNNQNVAAQNLTILSNQSFVIHKRMLFVNTQYNRAVNKSGFVYFNSFMNADIGSAYVLLKNISATTSLSYSSVKKWYEQIGIRQTLNGQVNEQINLSFFIDARKNMHVYQPLLYGPLRMDVSFQYSFKKN